MVRPMFKKSADLIHLHARTGSHATKGAATGRVDIRKRDHTDFDVRLESQQFKLARRELYSRINKISVELAPLLDAFILANERCDVVTAEALRPRVKILRDELHRLQKRKKKVARQVRLLVPLTE